MSYLERIKKMFIETAVVLSALQTVQVNAKTIHDNPDQYRNRDGIVTVFSGLFDYDYDDDDNWTYEEVSYAITNWFGKNSAYVSGPTFLSWIYDNQVTFLDGEGGHSGKNAASLIFGHPTGDWYTYRKTGEVNIYDEPIYTIDSVLDGFEDPANPGALVRPCDRPSDQVPVLNAVYREVPRWTDKEGDVSFASIVVDEIVKVLPDREEYWDEEEDSVQWEPQIWTTDTPKFRCNMCAEFPTYWKDDEIAFHIGSIPYKATLVVWSSSGADSPEPGREYYKKITFNGTVSKNGHDDYCEYFSIEASLGERLPPGRYTAYMDVCSPLSKYAPDFIWMDFDVVPPKLSIEVEPKACDWQAGRLTLHWRLADSPSLSDEESDHVIDESKKRFNIWRATGEGYENFANAELVGVNQAGAYWEDEKYAESLGVWPAKYWVQILDGDEKNIQAKPSSTPPASCVAGRRFGLAIGVGEFSKIGTTVLESEICQPVNDIALFKELFYREYGKCQGDYRELLNADANLESVRKSFAAVRTNADGSAHAKPGDILLLYMAMHGEQTKLALYDRYYSVDELHEDLSALDENSGIKVIAMLMACHSGALTEAMVACDDTITIENKFRNIAWIASCRGEQKSTAIENDIISLFGRCFLEFGWKHGNGDAASIVNKSGGPFGSVLPDGNRDGLLTFLELAQYARNLAVGCSSKYKSRVTTTGNNLLRTTDVLDECIPSAPAVPSAPMQFEGACINGSVVLKWSNDSNASFYCVYYRKTGSAMWEHYRLVESAGGPSVLSVFENTRDAVAGLPHYINLINELVHDPHRFEPDTCYFTLDYRETYEFKVAGVNASGVGPCSYVIQGTVRDYKDELMFNRVLEYSGNMQMNSGGSKGTLDVRVAVKDDCSGASSQSSDMTGVPVEIMAIYKRSGEDFIYTGEATVCSNEICTVALNGRDGILNLEMSSMGIIATLGEASAACLRSDDRGTFEIDAEAFKQKSVFVESDISAREDANTTVVVVGGDEGHASTVKLYLTYNTAAAADLDLAKGMIDGETPKGGLKFPLTLTWEKGEIGEKVITIPVKADKTVEDDEFFTLHLAEAEGMELGEARVCTVTIRDMNDKTLKAAVTPYRPKKGESVTTNSVSVAGADGGFVAGTGEYTSGSKLTLTAEARPGWAFAGWMLKGGDGSVLSDKAKWQVAVTNDAEYVAVFEKIPYIRGLADPADGGKVSGSGYCAAGKKVTLKATAGSNHAFVGWLESSAAIEYIATTPTLVIDRTARPAANSKTSTTITNAAEDVTYFAVFRSYPKVTVSVEDTDGKGAASTGRGVGRYVAGTITGEGKYAPGRKVTLKATANKGYVFAGWEGDVVSQAANLSFAMPSNDVEYVAKFVTADEDKDSITVVVDGSALEPWVSKSETNALATNIWAGVYLEWPVAAGALSEPKVKVSGLPAGLKFTDRPVTSRIGSGKTAVTVTNVPANTIYGAPTSPSRTTVDRKTGAVTVTPSAVKLTVTTAGKSTQTYQIDTVVDALPSWAQGAFAGGAVDGGQASLTVSAAGKVSGKVLSDGLVYTLAAPYYSSFETAADISNFVASVTANWSYKEGAKTVKTNDVVRLVVQDNGIGGCAAVEDWMGAYTVNWKIEPWKTLGKSFDRNTLTYAILADGAVSESGEDVSEPLGDYVTGRVTLKFAASGSVTVSGEFVTGYNEKTKKYATVRASGSATLVPVNEEQCAVFIYLTPKGLPPHARSLEVPWP